MKQLPQDNTLYCTRFISKVTGKATKFGKYYSGHFAYNETGSIVVNIDTFAYAMVIFNLVEAHCYGIGRGRGNC